MLSPCNPQHYNILKSRDLDNGWSWNTNLNKCFQIQIEGFDPDKFRAANDRTTGGNSELVTVQKRASNG